MGRACRTARARREQRTTLATVGSGGESGSGTYLLGLDFGAAIPWGTSRRRKVAHVAG